MINTALIFIEISVFLLVGAFICKALYKLHAYNTELIKRSHAIHNYIHQMEARLDLHEAALLDEGLMNISWEELMIQLNQVNKKESIQKQHRQRKDNIYYLNKTEDN